MSAGSVVVTSRSFATTDASPRLELEAAGLDVVRADPRHDLAELSRLLPEAVAWIAGTSPVTDPMLALGPRLRVLARYGVGYDAVDVAAATRRGLWVTTTPGANTEAVADLTVALLLDALRHVSAGVEAVRRGEWSARRGRELGALTVGLLGFGRIGQAVARRVLSFGASVVAVDPQLSVCPMDGVELADLPALAARCDVVSLHAPGGAVLLDREHAVPEGHIDHLWLRVRDLDASRRFYTTIAPHAGLRVTADEPGRVQVSGSDFSFSLVMDERPITEHVHIAFSAPDNETVRAFHAAAVGAGFEDHGEPGERAVYHAGYYGAFVLDPDGHNIEVVNHNGA